MKGAIEMRILYLMKVLLEETDEANRLSIDQLIEKMKLFGLEATKRNVKSEIGQLQQFGLTITMHEDQYCVSKRTFENAELKLLVDAVQSSKFITLEKSQNLIKKISSLTSLAEAKKLARQVFVVNRIKAVNEEIFANVDKLHDAISLKKKIAFRYFEYTVEKDIQFRNNGEQYIVSPYALSWDDENYYLITNYHKHDGLTHFRVDKMVDIEILDEASSSGDEDDSFNAADYQKRVFSMFGGTNISVTIQFEKPLINVVIDRFGKDVLIHSITDTHFQFTAKVAVSPAFFSWIFQFGNKAKILAPASVVDDMKKMIASSVCVYQ